MTNDIDIPIFDGHKNYEEDENLTALREFTKKLRSAVYPTPDTVAEATKLRARLLRAMSS